MAFDKTKPAGSDLVSDIDTLIQTNNEALVNTLGGLTGWKNLSVSNTSVTSITVTADSLYLQSATSIAYRATSVSEVIAITTSGAGGLVSSLSEASSTWYYIWIARKSTDGTTNGFLSTASDLTTFLTQVDADYDQATVVSAVRNDSSSDFISFKQTGNDHWYSTWQSVASGSPGIGSWTTLDVTAYFPSALTDNVVVGLYSPNIDSLVALTNNSANSIAEGALGTYYMGRSASEPAPTTSLYINIITANTLYWASNSGGAVRAVGFKINKL